ncbi:inositol monophosphatase [candidate division KSB1 bacterium]|nr:inositol monophosphatase [candidate division KSB1 bacterium]
MEYLDVAISAAKMAGEFLAQFQIKKQFTAHEKEDHYSLVSAADLGSEKIILETIRRYFPEHQILSEESPAAVSGAYTWVIDPLDGTSGYLRGFNNYSISIAVCDHCEVICGVVYNPVTNELFQAVKGGGAWLNGEPIRVSSVAGMRQAVVTLSHGDLRHFHRDSHFSKLFFEVNLVRLLNSCALELAYLAGGKSDGLVQVSQAIWDFAAGGLLVKEAGGALLNFAGAEIIYQVDQAFRTHILATNGRLSPHLLRYLQEFSTEKSRIRKPGE